jgi:hypothetical protein
VRGPAFFYRLHHNPAVPFHTVLALAVNLPEKLQVVRHRLKNPSSSLAVHLQIDASDLYHYITAHWLIRHSGSVGINAASQPGIDKRDFTSTLHPIVFSANAKCSLHCPQLFNHEFPPCSSDAMPSELFKCFPLVSPNFSLGRLFTFHFVALN